MAAAVGGEKVAAVSQGGGASVSHAKTAAGEEGGAGEKGLPNFLNRFTQHRSIR
jgi:hypothetical protein